MVKRRLSSRLKLLHLPLVLLMLISSFGCNEREPRVAPADVFKAGETAPDFELVGIDSKLYHLSDFKGQVVLINFWATWCAPCVLEMPSFERLYQSLKDKGFQIITINMDAPGKDAEVKKFAESYGLNFSVLRDPNYSVADKYGVSGFPETFIVDRDGKFISFSDPYAKSKLVRIISDRP